MIKTFNRYMSISATMFKAQMVYRFDVVMTSLETVGRILFAWILWRAIFNDRETIEGFTFQAMMFYYAASSFLASLTSVSEIGHDIARRIRDGDFTKYMVIPSPPQGYFWALTLGSIGYYAMFAAVAAAVCALLFRVGFGFTADPTAILLALVMIPIGLTFMTCYHFFIGLLAFKFQDVGFFLHTQSAVLEFAAGSVVPLILLPAAVVNVFSYVPFTHAVYTPVMLFMGRMNAAEGVQALAVITVWTGVIVLVNQWLYKRLRVKYDGVGI